MCTAATYKTEDFYFGRTLDYESSYGSEITITPRNYGLKLSHTQEMKQHFAIIGMAYVVNDYPLYYDAINEKGVGMAGLNFVGNACYNKPDDTKINVAQYEFIPFILGKCESVAQARELLYKINITDTAFNSSLPCAQLHWIIADKEQSIVVEAMKDGMHIYDNPVGVLTNNPPFDKQLFGLNNYMGLSPKQPENTFSSELQLGCYSRGMGALGLPGDLSSSSRFVRAAFTRLNSKSGKGELESVGQFFHILGSVEQQRGCCEVSEGEYEITIYTSCCNASKGIYYYTTYNNSCINAVALNRENLNASELFRYPLIDEQKINYQN